MSLPTRRSRERQVRADEAMQYGCEHCHRRWDDSAARPTRFTQRLASITAIVIVLACLALIHFLARRG